MQTMNIYEKQKSSVPKGVAFVWGLAEATCFFIVPDVFISYRALTGLKAALTACAFSVAGALIGGILMFTWAGHSNRALPFVERVPGITSSMVMTAHADYASHGTAALLFAPTRGIPYKLYSVIAPQYGVSVGMFVVVSAIARA